MIKQDVYDEVQGLEPLCQEICHTLWNHPELSGNERESANFLRKILSEEGFTIENNEHLEHAFIAEYGKGKPVIAILGEYDLIQTWHMIKRILRMHLHIFISMEYHHMQHLLRNREEVL